jgi:hypothetical protein
MSDYRRLFIVIQLFFGFERCVEIFSDPLSNNSILVPPPKIIFVNNNTTGKFCWQLCVLGLGYVIRLAHRYQLKVALSRILVVCNPFSWKRWINLECPASLRLHWTIKIKFFHLKRTLTTTYLVFEIDVQLFRKRQLFRNLFQYNLFVVYCTSICGCFDLSLQWFIFFYS